MKKQLTAALLALLLLALPVAAQDSAPGADVPPGGEGDAIFHAGSPSGLMLTGDGSWLITDLWNKAIWRLVPGQEPQLYAGRTGLSDVSGEPVGGYNDAELLESAFQSPWAIVPFLGGYLVSDPGNHAVRFIGPDDRVKTAVGSGEAGYADGRGVAALFSGPTGLAVDDEGNAYIADTGNHRIRKLAPDGQVTTVAGTGSAGSEDGTALSASLNSPTGLCWHDGALYIADTGNHLIRKLEGETLSTMAGVRYEAGDDGALSGDYLDGPAAEARFAGPQGVAMGPDGALYVADTANSAVRKIQDDQVTTLVKASPVAGDTYPISPRGLCFDGDRLYITDTFAGVVFCPTAGGLLGYGDLWRTQWHAPAVSFMVRNGLMGGIAPEVFGHDSGMTRGMFVTVLGRLYASQNPGAVVGGQSAFPDLIDGKYYTDAARWAADNGLMLGSDGLMRPDMAVDRETVATFLLRYATFMGLDNGARGDLSAFSDAGQVSAWAEEAMAWAVGNGVIRGDDQGLLNPGKNATRAETAQMIFNFWQTLVRV